MMIKTENFRYVGLHVNCSCRKPHIPHKIGNNLFCIGRGGYGQFVENPSNSDESVAKVSNQLLQITAVITPGINYWEAQGTYCLVDIDSALQKAIERDKNNEEINLERYVG
jgi:hypothetical protein